MAIPEDSVPFNRSSLQGRELEHIAETIAAGQIAGCQSFSARCQSLLETTLEARQALLTTSCTHALEMAALLLGIAPGDEVIVPSFSFVSTASAFVLRGARPVFCDIRPDTLNLDERRLESLITRRTRALVPVHYAGIACEMDTILEIARAHRLEVVEDDAHGLFGRYRGRWLGTLGTLGALSFHETKNITCGEGGALLINDERYLKAAEVIRDKGTDRARFLRGEVDKYSWVGLGSSYVMSDVLAAFLYGQLEARDAIQEKRRKIWERYHHALAPWCAANDVRQPVVPAHCDQAWHLYYLLLPSEAQRQELMDSLRAKRILAVFHYQPLHSSEYAARWGAASCPVTEDVSRRLLRLPFYNDLTPNDQDRVIAAITEMRWR